jgi:hypothetical protein
MKEPVARDGIIVRIAEEVCRSRGLKLQSAPTKITGMRRMKEHFHHSDDTLGMSPPQVAILEHEPHESAGLIEADLRGQGA